MLALFILALVSASGAQQSGFDGNRSPASNFNNNIDPFGRRPFGAGDLSNAIFVEP